MYRDPIEFAKRTIEIYKSYETQYEFTAASGALLNVLTSICPDNDFLIDIDEYYNDFPGIIENNEYSIKEYLLNIRHGLAHKTEINFKDYIRNEKIAFIQITSNLGIIVRLDRSELDKIIDWIELRIDEVLKCLK